MNDTHRPTLDDVARVAGVSTATVSRCLNSPDRVVQATRDRVMGAINRLGYVPNFSGRALASKRTNTIGAVIPTMENAIFARGIQAFQETLAKAGITLLVASSGYDFDQESEMIRTLVARGADGLLLIGTARPQATFDYLRRLGIPYVLAWNLGPSSEHCIGFDNEGAAADIAARVLELGHRNIVMIAGITAMNDRAADRVAGVRRAMREAGLQDEALAITETHYTFEDGSEAFDALMNRRPRPTAVICGNDVLAVGALARAKERGLRVPEDVSITGFDDIDIASYVEPPLTTVHVPHRRMGTAAAELLLELISGRDANIRIGIETATVERGSLARPPD